MSNRWPISQFKRRIRVSVQHHFQRSQQHRRVHESRNRWILNGTRTNGGILLQIQTRWNCFDDPERGQHSRQILTTGYLESWRPLDSQTRISRQRKSLRITGSSWRIVAFRFAQFARQFLVERIGSAGRANYIGWKRNGNVHGLLVGGETSAGRNDHLTIRRAERRTATNCWGNNGTGHVNSTW
jgi:hypothetical protein